MTMNKNFRHRDKKKKKKIQFVMIEDVNEQKLSETQDSQNSELEEPRQEETPEMLELRRKTEREHDGIIFGHTPKQKLPHQNTPNQNNIIKEQDVDCITHEAILQMNQVEFSESFEEYYNRWVGNISDMEDPMEQFRMAMEFFKSEIDNPEKGYAICIGKLKMYLLYVRQNEDRIRFEDEEISKY